MQQSQRHDTAIEHAKRGRQHMSDSCPRHLACFDFESASPVCKRIGNAKESPCFLFFCAQTACQPLHSLSLSPPPPPPLSIFLPILRQTRNKHLSEGEEREIIDRSDFRFASLHPAIKHKVEPQTTIKRAWDRELREKKEWIEWRKTPTQQAATKNKIVIGNFYSFISSLSSWAIILFHYNCKDT